MESRIWLSARSQVYYSVDTDYEATDEDRKYDAECERLGFEPSIDGSGFKEYVYKTNDSEEADRLQEQLDDLAKSLKLDVCVSWSVQPQCPQCGKLARFSHRQCSACGTDIVSYVEAQETEKE